MNNLQQAINRSVSHDEIVSCVWNGGDESDLIAELATLYEGEIFAAKENDGTIDVWGTQPSDFEDLTAWRLRVELTRGEDDG